MFRYRHQLKFHIHLHSAPLFSLTGFCRSSCNETFLIWSSTFLLTTRRAAQVRPTRSDTKWVLFSSVWSLLQRGCLRQSLLFPESLGIALGGLEPRPR